MKPAGEQIIITMWFLRFFHRILNYKQVSACVEFFVWRSLMSWYPLLLFFFFFYTFNITRLDPEINSRKFKKKDETTTLLLATYSKEWKLYNCFYRSNFSNPDGGKILIHFIRFFLSLSLKRSRKCIEVETKSMYAGINDVSFGKYTWKILANRSNMPLFGPTIRKSST